MRLTAILVSSSAILGGLLQAASGAAEPRVMLGNEVLAAGGFRELTGKRVGLITNPSGVNRDLQTTIELLHSAPGVKLVALFGPEHGIYGDVPAGDKVESRTDPRTGLPVHSLYGATRKPTPAMLAGLDAVVYDLQDTGCRSYTFISTFDKVNGTEATRLALQAGRSAAEIVAGWKAGEEQFRREREKYLRY